MARHASVTVPHLMGIQDSPLSCRLQCNPDVRPGPSPRTSENKDIPAGRKAEGFESLTYRAIWLHAAAKCRDASESLAVVYMPGAQLLGLCLLSVLEIVVGLHEKKPSALPIADRTCLL